MILYVNGDSHSCGHDAGGIDFSYGKYLANSLDATLVCAARSGSSNARIIRTTTEYLKNNTPDFIIIGWSTWEREEWLFDGKYYNVNSAGSDVLPKELVNQYKQWVIDKSHNYEENETIAHQYISEFHSVLTNKNIPHLFFNCYSDFHTVSQQDWNRCYISPYDVELTYWKWLTNNGYKSNKWFHYGADAHIAWADFLLPHLTNILKESIITT